jgi:hypothetical protein
MTAGQVERIALGILILVGIGSAVHGVQAQGTSAPPSSTAADKTPRTPDGKPDLNGYWGAGPIGFNLGGESADPNDLAVEAPLRNGDISNLTNDNVIIHRSGDDLPLYKPQYWDKVLDLDYNGNLTDPFNSCFPAGLPRMGPPAKILQLPNELVFFYTGFFQRNDFRDIPIGPRTHPVDRDGTWVGDPVAHWDGDTLVVETEGFNDQTWIGPEGYLHDYDLKVTEKFRREGDTLIYDVTVEDPGVLQKAWVLPTQKLKRITVPNYRMEEAPPCSERDNAHLQGKNREQ